MDIDSSTILIMNTQELHAIVRVCAQTVLATGVCAFACEGFFPGIITAYISIDVFGWLGILCGMLYMVYIQLKKRV